MARDDFRDPEANKRMLRGCRLIEDGITPKQLAEDDFEVPSGTNGDTYLVSKYANSWKCTCPDFKFRHIECKHIHAVKFWLRLSAKLLEDQDNKGIILPLQPEKPACKFYRSDHVIKYGKANNKQVYKCKNCNRKFVPNEGFQKMWYDPRIVAVTLDLHFKGISLRKIADHLHQFYGLFVDHSTVYRWIAKYVDMIEMYVATLEPNVSNIWHSDEMKVKFSGEWHWMWNIMDEKTRFQLVSVIKQTHEVEDAKKVFKQSKKTTANKPSVVVTDGLQGYHRAFNSEFYDHHQSVKHIANVGLQDGLNNILERLNGTVREREKVMRGLKIPDTPIIAGNQIYYNFIRPHQALDGMTPAEVAGIGVGGNERWLNLLKFAISNNH